MRIAIGVVAALIAAFAACAQAQEPASQFPSRTIRIIVPYSPGGGADSVGRLVAKHLGDAWKQPVVVENRTGADGRIGTEAAGRSPADGYTLLLATDNQFTIIPHLFPNAEFNALRDLEPVANVAGAPLVLVAAANVPANSLAELVQIAKTRPGALNYGTSGVASLHNVIGQNLSRLAGIQLQHVPYKGTSAAAQDLAGGQLQLLFGNLSSIQPLVKAGKAKVIAVTSEKRFALLPDTPSIGETVSGWGDFATSFGIVAPKATSPAIVEKLNAEIIKGLQTADFRERLLAAGLLPTGGSPAQYKSRTLHDAEVIGSVIKAAGIKAE